jgi:hypothetical protein
MLGLSVAYPVRNMPRVTHIPFTRVRAVRGNLGFAGRAATAYGVVLDAHGKIA